MANLGALGHNHHWKSNAIKQGGIRDRASGVIQLRACDLPDYDELESDEQIKKRLKERFEIMEEMTQEVIDGNVRGLIISGPPGLGKTFGVQRRLKEWDPEGAQFTSSSGYVKATGLYKQLWQRRFANQKLLYDDCDSIWFDETALQFMKIATDSINERIVTYGAEYTMEDEDGQPIPRKFEFEGAMIFVTNLDFDLQIARGTKLAPHMEAMMSRSHYISMGMKTKRDFLIRIYMAAEEGLLSNLGLTESEEDEVLEFIANNLNSLRDISLRTALKIAQLYQSSSSIDWKTRARITCCRA